jgi:hypothetical protein
MEGAAAMPQLSPSGASRAQGQRVAPTPSDRRAIMSRDTRRRRQRRDRLEPLLTLAPPAVELAEKAMEAAQIVIEASRRGEPLSVDVVENGAIVIERARVVMNRLRQELEAAAVS